MEIWNKLDWIVVVSKCEQRFYKLIPTKFFTSKEKCICIGSEDQFTTSETGEGQKNALVVDILADQFTILFLIISNILVVFGLFFF
jgi:hypothetical protein